MVGEDMGKVPSGLSRREALVKGAGLTAAWTFVGLVEADAAATPAGFPSNIPLYTALYQNWAQDITVKDALTCAPKSAQEVLSVVNWAAGAGYRVRPRGHMHNWSPLTFAPGSGPASVILVDTTKHLTGVQINNSGGVTSVTAQTGVEMQELLSKLQDAGLGFNVTPAPGDLTLGGVLAINGHGTSVPVASEPVSKGLSFGSLSNNILSLSAIVFDPARGEYVLKRFLRNDPTIGPLLAHVGRAFIVQVTLQVAENKRMRCVSFMNVPASELFAAQGSRGRTFASYVLSSGRVEAIWFPFTTFPWMKVWTHKPLKPLLSRRVFSPYNYPFSDNIPVKLADLIGQLVSGNQKVTPLFGKTQEAICAAGLTATVSHDIWGWSKDVLLYVKPTTLRVTANGYAVILHRSNIQRSINEFVTFYQERQAAWAARGLYPMNGPIEIRVTGLDQSNEVNASGAQEPWLSAARPCHDHPDWDVAVWFDILTIPSTPNAAAFYREIEQWMYTNYASYARVRVEWSKGWAYSQTAAWSDPTVLSTTVPQTFRIGQPVESNWDAAHKTLDALDPRRVFTSPLVNELLG